VTPSSLLSIGRMTPTLLIKKNHGGRPPKARPDPAPMTKNKNKKRKEVRPKNKGAPSGGFEDGSRSNDLAFGDRIYR
jgi:hypothetical protein